MLRADERHEGSAADPAAKAGPSRLSEVTNTLALLRALCRYPHTLRRLAELIGKHPRTVRRYLEALEELRAPIQSDLRRTESRWVRVWWMRPGAAWAWLVTEPGEARRDARNAAEIGA